MTTPPPPPAEILLGGVYIWGNPQLCFPDPQNIVWRDTLDEQNIHAGPHRLQPRASNCEHSIQRSSTFAARQMSSYLAFSLVCVRSQLLNGVPEQLLGRNCTGLPNP